jgi:hypothetical protein
MIIEHATAVYYDHPGSDILHPGSSKALFDHRNNAGGGKTALLYNSNKSESCPLIYEYSSNHLIAYSSKAQQLYSAKVKVNPFSSK